MNTQRFSKVEKYSVIAMALVALAGFVMAKPVFANEACQHGHWDQAKRGEFFDKRTSELHDKLQLTATQETDWNTFISKVRPGERPAKPSREEMAKLPTPERMEQRLAVRQEMLKQMEARVEATKEFYSHLTTEQRQIFDASFQPHHHAEDRG
jgi:acetoin utilization deacetylase AcuC-like enzyme